MATTKDQTELKRLINRLTPANPQRNWASREGPSGLGQALIDIATAVDSVVSGGQYYANENKSLSRKINELCSENQVLKSAPRLGPDYYAKENKGLSRKINDLHHENDQLKAENTALSVENMTWKTFYAQVMAGGALNQEPPRPQYGPMNPDRWQRMEPAAATTFPGAKPVAAGPTRPSLAHDRAEQLAAQYATAHEQRERTGSLAPQYDAPRERRPGAMPEAAPNLAAKDSKKRSYSDVDAAPPAKTRKLDYGHPIVRQVVKATAWAPGDSRVTVPKFGETMFGRPGAADEHRRSESKENTKAAVPELGETMYSAPALDAPGTDDRRSMSEPKHDFQFTLPKTFGGPGAQDVSGRCSLSEPRDSAKLAAPKSDETSSHNAGSNAEPKHTSQLAELQGGETTVGASNAYGYRYGSESEEEYKLAESRFLETMFGAPATKEQTFKAEPEDGEVF